MNVHPEGRSEPSDPALRTGAAPVTDHSAENAQRAYARLAGGMYLLLLVVDIAGVLITSSVAGAGSFGDISQRILASETLYRIGLCCGLVGSLVTILLAIGLYVTVKPVDGNLALMALLFRVVEAAIGAIGTILAFNVLQIHLAASHANAFDANQLGALATFSSGVGTDVGAIFFPRMSIRIVDVRLGSHRDEQPLAILREIQGARPMSAAARQIRDMFRLPTRL